ncbi:MAG: AAC(3)-I family aminoglycoside N-acetyltransferase [Candidatus Viridilinea halotolerans]|uniref:AAC(3)-I family aminoglycoside N-acetyltransferase n=1 Tax=Candidatus Viridilinea halotolerans TaxID=2491704 RepID=A0A426TSJ0_9CHLR|nr:MAG: AAC(3)-I family aminoglycoside N-acetyltransferase [Candidatus Viridilinea halotolerans]
MTKHADITIQQLTTNDQTRMAELLTLFGHAFDDVETYSGRRPSEAYMQRLLSQDHFIVLVAIRDDAVVGGIAAYELMKFEQERSEIYLYDLAVASDQRRQGVATTLIHALQQLAAQRGACVIFVQADAGDDPAIALYTKFGTPEFVYHFDLTAP